MLKYFVQYVVAIILLVTSTFFTWYEGSAIREDPFEWKYTAYFSKMINGEVTSSADISQLDHFLYAAKFTPLYPTLLIICISYILILSGFLLLRRNPNVQIMFHLITGILYFVCSRMVSDSPTLGGKSFTITFLAIGIFHFALATLFYMISRKEDGHRQNFNGV